MHAVNPERTLHMPERLGNVLEIRPAGTGGKEGMRFAPVRRNGLLGPALRVDCSIVGRLERLQALVCRANITPVGAPIAADPGPAILGLFARFFFADAQTSIDNTARWMAEEGL